MFSVFVVVFCVAANRLKAAACDCYQRVSELGGCFKSSKASELQSSSDEQSCSTIEAECFVKHAPAEIQREKTPGFSPSGRTGRAVLETQRVPGFACQTTFCKASCSCFEEENTNAERVSNGAVCTLYSSLRGTSKRRCCVLEIAADMERRCHGHLLGRWEYRCLLRQKICSSVAEPIYLNHWDEKRSFVFVCFDICSLVKAHQQNVAIFVVRTFEQRIREQAIYLYMFQYFYSGILWRVNAYACKAHYINLDQRKCMTWQLSNLLLSTNSVLPECCDEQGSKFEEEANEARLKN